jgi:SAM-dependent methyltransferase
MALFGWSVTGLDAAATAVNRIRDELGFPALLGSLPHPELTPGSFDVVTMWHSLEHVHDPLAVLREARRVHVPGGRLIAAVPNIESLPFYVFGRSWFGLDLPRHLTHFSPKTLRAMLEVAGFHVQSVRSIRHSDWLRSSAKLAVRDSRGGWGSRLLRSKPLSKLAAWVCYAAGLSDCMMAVAERPL